MTAAAIVLVSLVSGVPVEAKTLDGEVVLGELVALASAELVVQADGVSRTLPVANLHEVRLTESGGGTSLRQRSQSEIRLVDGSRLTVDDAELSAATMTAASERFDDFQIPKATVRTLRWGKSDSQVQAMWLKLAEQENGDDLVVVRKGDALDHYGGVVTGIDAESVKFLLDGNSVPIPRERVFGVVFANRPAASRSAIAQIDLTGGDQLQVDSVDWEDEHFRARLAAGPSVRLRATDVERLDFSLGKIRYLSDDEPVAVEYAPLELSGSEEFPEIAADVLRYRRGKTREGRPLQVGGKEYTQGLWLHSGTTITYRLFREYRRFRAIMDIDQDIVSEFCDPVVDVVIRGDGQELFKSTVRRADDAQELDIDVTNVRELQIEVIPTDPTGMCEHLDLADARVIQ